jgi:hypothetical protein
MPIDPRLIHPDDAPLRADGNLDLPDDLSALAEQLADDAAHLSARYPADREPQVALAAELVRSAERIKRRAWRPAMFIAGATLASVAAMGLTLSLLAPRHEQNHATDLVSSPIVRSAATAPFEPSATMPVSFPVPSPTALSLGELSAPEMEALLDLLQRDPNRASSISF